MQTYELLVKERSVQPNSADMTMVRTSVGIDKVHILFDNAEWLDFGITITFGNGNTLVTQPLVVSALADDLWVAEAECVVPWEVLQDVGNVRVTLQGTDSDDRHIITAYGAPLSVEEAGDTDDGEPPEDAPTIDQYTAAMNAALEAANEASSAAEAAEDAAEAAAQAVPIATYAIAGKVKPDGNTVTIDSDGTISAVQQGYTLPTASSSRLGGVKVGNNLTIGSDGTLNASAGGSKALWHGTSDTAGAYTEKVVTCADFALSADSVIAVTFAAGHTTASALTLNVNSTGAKAIYTGGAATSSSNPLTWEPNDTLLFMYDGTGYMFLASDGASYTLPIASSSTLGGVKLGDNISANAYGTLHYELPIAGTGSGALGGVKVDNSTITIQPDGTISASGGGSSTQSDWNQEDAGEDDYIQNRPFYGTPYSTYLLYEQTFESATPTQGTEFDYQPYSLVSENVSISVDIEAGMEYLVTVGSEETVRAGASTEFTVQDSGGNTVKTIEGPYILLDGVMLIVNNASSKAAVFLYGQWGGADSVGPVTATVQENYLMPEKLLDANFISVDGDTIKVNSNGELYVDIAAVAAAISNL